MTMFGSLILKNFWLLVEEKSNKLSSIGGVLFVICGHRYFK